MTLSRNKIKCPKLCNNCKLCKFIASIIGARLSRKLRSLYVRKFRSRRIPENTNVMNGNARFVMNEAGCKHTCVRRVHVHVYA